MAGKSLLLCACLSLALLGCQTGTPEQRAVWAREASRPILCAEGPDCDLKWSRALDWVRTYSAYRITRYSRDIIATAGPKRYDDYPAYTVLRIAKGEGVYRIALQWSCEGIEICLDTSLRDKASFVSYVLDR